MKILNYRTEYILDWFEGESEQGSPEKLDILLKISQNIVVQNMEVEDAGEEENIIVIPLMNDYFSQNILPGANPFHTDKYISRFL